MVIRIQTYLCLFTNVFTLLYHLDQRSIAGAASKLGRVGDHLYILVSIQQGYQILGQRVQRQRRAHILCRLGSRLRLRGLGMSSRLNPLALRLPLPLLQTEHLKFPESLITASLSQRHHTKHSVRIRQRRLLDPYTDTTISRLSWDPKIPCRTVP